MQTSKHSSNVDTVLIQNSRKEDKAAILLNQHKDQLYYAAYLLVRDRYLAEDIFQEACIKVLKSMRKGNYAEEGKFVPWVARIVRNLCIDHIRKAKRHTKVTLPDGGDIFELIGNGRKNQEEVMMQRHTTKTVRRVLEEIPYEQREVVVMRIYGDLSFKEIARLTDTSINTVLGRMRYGLLNMKKMIQDKKVAI
jgi:RNA polymerase sigma-70 factor (ECF subfamily)